MACNSNFACKKLWIRGYFDLTLQIRTSFELSLWIVASFDLKFELGVTYFELENSVLLCE